MPVAPVAGTLAAHHSAALTHEGRGDVHAVRRRVVEVRSQAYGDETRPELLVADCLVGVVLGDASAMEAALAAAAGLMVGSELALDVAALKCLIAHDLGRPGFPARYAGAVESGALTDPFTYQWAAIRIATERNDLGAAVRADRLPTPSSAPPLVRQLRACASAALAVERCRPDDARARLVEVLDIARETGSTLVVPEALARLIMLDAYTDLASARQRFEQFEESVGDGMWLPRENVLKMVARSAMRAADGRPGDAASAAAAAADVAERAGLVLLAAQAHRHRAIQLSAAGRSSEARLAVAAAARWQRSTLTPRLTAWLDPADVVGPDDGPETNLAG